MIWKSYNIKENFLFLVDVQFCKIKQNLANLKQLNIKEPKLKLKQIW